MRGVSRNYFLGDEESSFGVDTSEEILAWNVHESDSTGTNSSSKNIVAIAIFCDNDVNKDAIVVGRWLFLSVLHKTRHNDPLRLTNK